MVSGSSSVRGSGRAGPADAQCARNAVLRCGLWQCPRQGQSTRIGAGVVSTPRRQLSAEMV